MQKDWSSEDLALIVHNEANSLKITESTQWKLQ